MDSFRVSTSTKAILILAAVLFASTWLIFSPKIFASSDEYAYVKGAFLLSGGSLFVDEPGLYCPTPQLPSGKYGSNYPIGKSIQLIPFAIWERLDVLFIAGMLTHLLNFFIVILILKNKKINPIWSILYLAFPAFQWESRTLYAELWLLTFFLAAYLTWQRDTKKSTMLAGLLLGAAIFIRYDAALGLAAFALQAIIKERHRIIPLLAGAAGPFLLVLGYNWFLYGSPFSTGYGSAASLLSKTLPLSLIVELITFPILVFVTLPFSLYAAHKTSAHRILFLSLAVMTFLFFVRFSSFWALGISPVQIFTVRLRYFIPLLGLLMIPTIEWYAGKWNTISKKWSFVSTHAKQLVLIAAIFLVAATVVLHATHAHFLEERIEINRALHANIPENSTIIGSGDDCMFFTPQLTGTKYYAGVATNPALEGNSTFVINISYSTQENTGTSRQNVINRQRKQIKEFIIINQDHLTKVYSDDFPFIEIWRYAP